MSSGSWGGLNGSLPRVLDPPESGGRSDEEIDAASAAHQDLASEWVADTSYAIPGMGQRPENCGVYRPYHVCDSCGEPIFAESHCGLRRCPSCWWEWVLTTAEKIVYKIQAYRWAQESGLDRRLIHAMFSPEDETTTISQTESMMRESYERAGESGVTAGAALKHIWRTTDDLDAEFEAATAAGVDAGKWSYLRDEYGAGWRIGTEVAPHVHQLAVAPEFEPPEGWVSKRIRTLEPFYSLTSAESYEDVAGLAKYLLTHTSIKDGEQAVRWFGEAYPGGFSPEEELSKGARETIERMAHEAVYGEELGDEEDDELRSDSCEAGTEGCAGQPMPVWDAPMALRQGWWDVDREVERRIEACIEWMMGDLDPPVPPRSEDAAREALDELVELL